MNQLRWLKTQTQGNFCGALSHMGLTEIFVEMDKYALQEITVRCLYGMNTKKPYQCCQKQINNNTNKLQLQPRVHTQQPNNRPKSLQNLQQIFLTFACAEKCIIFHVLQICPFSCTRDKSIYTDKLFNF